MTGTIHVDRDDAHVCTITIDNREKRNALSPDFIPDLTETFRSLQGDDSVRTVVITGAGDKAFCAGYDLDAVTDREERVELMGSLIEALSTCEYPTVARINGDAIGGGFNIATACDLRVAVEDARFGVPTAKYGLVYPDDSIVNAINVIGAPNTKELMFTGELVDADRATEMGLLNYVVPRAELDERTRELATAIASNAPLSLKGMKRIIAASEAKTHLTDAEKQWARHLKDVAETSRDHDEAMEALAEDREPEFEGH